VAAYANLTKEERRQKALQIVGTWLENHCIHLTDHELAALVELLYAWVKKMQPHRIAPEPEFSSRFADPPASRVPGGAGGRDETALGAP
jgi:hypothetical protein